MKSTHKGHLRSPNPTLGCLHKQLTPRTERDAVGRRKEKHQDAHKWKKDKQLLFSPFSPSENRALIYYGWKLILFSLYRASAIITCQITGARLWCAPNDEWWFQELFSKLDNLRPRARNEFALCAKCPAGVAGTSSCIWTVERQSARALLITGGIRIIVFFFCIWQYRRTVFI